jgi:hypothetical protein
VNSNFAAPMEEELSQVFCFTGNIGILYPSRQALAHEKLAAAKEIKRIQVGISKAYTYWIGLIIFESLKNRPL